MADVISLEEVRVKIAADNAARIASAPKMRKRRGLGVMIRAPHADTAFGVLGGNLEIRAPGCMIGVSNREFDLSELGRRIREARGIVLDLEEVVRDPDPEPPAPLVA